MSLYSGDNEAYCSRYVIVCIHGNRLPFQKVEARATLSALRTYVPQLLSYVKFNDASDVALKLHEITRNYTKQVEVI